MMKNGIKKLVFGALFVGVGLCAVELEEFNQIIAEAKHPDNKQVLICEREYAYIKKNPQECLKAIDMLLKSKKNLKAGYKFEYYGTGEAVFKALWPDDYKQTDKEFIDSFIANSYLNAGVIYSALSQQEVQVKMYQKAVEYKPNSGPAHFNLGTAYYYGQGVGVNKIKTYEHWKIAAKQGIEQAQNNLDFLCRESPWACK